MFRPMDQKSIPAGSDVEFVKNEKKKTETIERFLHLQCDV